MAGQLDTSILEELFGARQAGIKQESSSLIKILQESQGILDKQQQAARDAAAAQQEGILLEGAAKDKQQAATAEFASKLGVNSASSNYMLNELAYTVNKDAADLLKTRAGLQKRLNTGIVDDPLMWVYNQLTLDDDLKAAEFQAGTLKARFDMLSGLSKATADVTNISALVQQADATDMAAAKIKAVQSALDQDLAKLELKKQELGISEVKLGAAQTQEQFEVFAKYLAVKDGLEMRGLRAEAMAEKASEEDSLRANLSLVSAYTGQNITLPQYKGMSAAKRDIVNTLMGAVTNQSNSTETILSNLKQVSGSLTDGLSRLDARLAKPRERAELDNNVQWPTLKPVDRIRLVDTAYKQQIARESLNIPDVGGIYSPPKLATVLSVPAVGNSFLGKSLASFVAADPNRDTSAKGVLDMATLIVAKGTPPATAAQDVANFFTAAATQNNQALQYEKLHLGSMQSYPHRIKEGPFSKDRTINLMDKTAVENYIVRRASAQNIPGGDW